MSQRTLLKRLWMADSSDVSLELPDVDVPVGVETVALALTLALWQATSAGSRAKERTAA